MTKYKRSNKNDILYPISYILYPISYILLGLFFSLIVNASDFKVTAPNQWKLKNQSEHEKIYLNTSNPRQLIILNSFKTISNFDNKIEDKKLDSISNARAKLMEKMGITNYYITGYERKKSQIKGIKFFDSIQSGYIGLDKKETQVIERQYRASGKTYIVTFVEKNPVINNPSQINTTLDHFTPIVENSRSPSNYSEVAGGSLERSDLPTKTTTASPVEKKLPAYDMTKTQYQEVCKGVDPEKQRLKSDGSFVETSILVNTVTCAQSIVFTLGTMLKDLINLIGSTIKFGTDSEYREQQLAAAGIILAEIQKSPTEFAKNIVNGLYDMAATSYDKFQCYNTQAQSEIICELFTYLAPAGLLGKLVTKTKLTGAEVGKVSNLTEKAATKVNAAKASSAVATSSQAQSWASASSKIDDLLKLMKNGSPNLSKDAIKALGDIKVDLKSLDGVSAASYNQKMGNVVDELGRMVVNSKDHDTQMEAMKALAKFSRENTDGYVRSYIVRAGSETMSDINSNYLLDDSVRKLAHDELQKVNKAMEGTMFDGIYSEPFKSSAALKAEDRIDFLGVSRRELGNSDHVYVADRVERRFGSSVTNDDKKVIYEALKDGKQIPEKYRATYVENLELKNNNFLSALEDIGFKRNGNAYVNPETGAKIYFKDDYMAGSFLPQYSPEEVAGIKNAINTGGVYRTKDLRGTMPEPVVTPSKPAITLNDMPSRVQEGVKTYKVESSNPYERLGLNIKEATPQKIDEAYKKARSIFHSDKYDNLSGEQKQKLDQYFNKIQEAHDMLSAP